MNVQNHVYRKQITKISLSSDAKSLILGSLLGNGCLRICKGYKNAKFSICHSNEQKNYLEWKANILFGSSGTICKPDGFSKEVKWVLQSHVSEKFTQIHQVTHKLNKLNIRRTWLNHFTELSLAIWWFDNGSLICHRRRGVLCTDGFDEKSCLLLSHYLLKVWKISVKVKPIYRQKYEKYYYRLWFSTEELKKFLTIIAPYTPPILDLFEKKMIICYKDQVLQQRWISELISLLDDEKNLKVKAFLEKFRERYSPTITKIE